MARVILESEDKEQFEVLREVALKSTVIRQMIETNPDNDEPIPLVDRRWFLFCSRCCFALLLSLTQVPFPFCFRCSLFFQLQVQHPEEGARLFEEASRI
jgi:hypothetical protein